MDPLSITASVMTVLHVTNKAVSFLVTLSHASKEKNNLIDELKHTRKGLEDLAQLSSNVDSNPAAEAQLPTLKRVTDLTEESSPLARCNKDIEALNVSLASASVWAPEGSRRNEAMQRLKWPFKDKEVSKVLERLATCRAELAAALSVDQTNLALKIHGSVQTLVDRTSLIHDDNRYKKMFEWLGVPEPSINHNAARKKWVKTTGDWFLQSQRYANWRSTPHSLIWLHAIPGCGKTVLSSTIIEDIRTRCEQNVGYCLAYFYFDFNNPRNDGCKMIRSLVWQLSTQDSAAFSLLDEIHTSCKSAQPTDDALMAVLKKMVLVIPQSYIVLDALDECQSREILLEAIEHVAAWQHEGLHILVTSRCEADLKESLEPLAHESGTMNIQSAAMDEDIRRYIRTRLSDKSPLKRWQKRPEVQGEITTTLMEKADGMFRLAECQLDALQKCLNLTALRQTLETLPSTLYATYEQILCSINHRQDAIKAFQWILYSEQNLYVEELVDVLAIDAGNEPRFVPDRRMTEQEDVLSICSSLITFDYQEDYDGETRPIVKLAHSSVRDYLISQDILRGPASGYAIDYRSAHTTIAGDCIAYLIDTTKESKGSYLYDYVFLLYSYAIRYWDFHVRIAGEQQGRLSALVHELFHMQAFPYYFRRRTRSMARVNASPSTVEIESYRLIHASESGLPKRVEDILRSTANSVFGIEGVRNRAYGTALLSAVRSQHITTVKTLIVYGADVNHVARENNIDYPISPLIVAVQNGDISMVTLLLSNKAQVNIEDTSEQPLLIAVKSEYTEMVATLIAAGADVRGESGICRQTAVQVAARKGNVAIIRMLIAAGAELDPKDRGRSTLYNAVAGKGALPMVQFLLDSGANVHDEHQKGTICIAASHGYDHIIQLLLDYGMSVKASKDSKANPDDKEDPVYAIWNAVYWKHESTTRLLLANGANANHSYGSHFATPLHIALMEFSEQGEAHPMNIVRLLLQSGADVNIQGGVFGNPLQAACQFGSLEVVELLLQSGANFNIQGGRYGNPLQGACQSGSLEVVELLLQSGANVNMQGGKYGNPLQAACQSGSLEVVELLLQHEANVNAEGGYHGTALQAAASKEHVAAVQLLLDRGANPNLGGGEYYGSALHVAATRLDVDLVRLLLDNGADINIWDSRCGTALQSVMKNKNSDRRPKERLLSEEIANLLLDRGTNLDLQGGFCGGVRQAVMEHGIEEMKRFVQERTPGCTSNSEIEVPHAIDTV
ncbi:MAG: hypothetical protein Q9168_006962 [Polycauliona sp. 1 TL-2023]